MKTIKEIQAILTRPFAVSEIRWRVGQAFVRRDHNPEQGERARGRQQQRDQQVRDSAHYSTLWHSGHGLGGRKGCL